MKNKYTKSYLVIFIILTCIFQNSFASLGDDDDEDLLLKSYKVSKDINAFKKPKSLSIIAGQPLTGGNDTNGGFGDVAANIQMAIAFKKKYPAMYVQLVVELVNEKRESVASVEKIINTLLPKINTQLFYKEQNYLGVNVIVLPKKSAADILKASIDHKPVIKKCDLSIQYSANSAANNDLLQATGKSHFSFREPGNGTGLIEKGNSFQSGLDGAGIYNTSPPHDKSISRLNVINYLNQMGHDIKDTNQLRLAYAYTKNKNSSVYYQKAIFKKALENSQKKYLVLVKNGFEVTDLKAPNFKIIPLRQFEMSLGNDFIAASDLPPLVTGDSSSATALLTSHSERLFFYESLPWKENYMHNLRIFIKNRIQNLDLSKYYVNPDEYKSQIEIEKIYSGLDPNNETRFLSLFFSKIKKSKDILENTLKIYSIMDSLGQKSIQILYSFEQIQNIIKPLFYESFDSGSKAEMIKNITEKMHSRKLNSFDYIVYSSLKMLLGNQLTLEEKKMFIKKVSLLEQSQIIELGKMIGAFLMHNKPFQDLSHDLINLQKQVKPVEKLLESILKIEGAQFQHSKQKLTCSSLF